MNTNKQATLNAVVAYISKEFSSRIGELHDRFEIILRDSWPDMKDSSQQLTARLTLRWLVANKAAVQSTLNERMAQALMGTSTSTASVDIDAMQILDDKMLSTSVHQTQLMAGLTEQAKYEINGLERRLGKLQLAGLAIDPKAISPKSIAGSLMGGLGRLNPAPEVLSLLVNMYLEQGLESLAGFYGQTNRTLNERGLS